MSGAVQLFKVYWINITVLDDLDIVGFVLFLVLIRLVLSILFSLIAPQGR